jgi:uncharacterized protein
VSDAGSYGFIELITAGDGTGIRGGTGGGADYAGHAFFYVGVEDVEAALQRAERLGGTRVMGPARSPNGLVVGAEPHYANRRRAYQSLLSRTPGRAKK